MTNKAWFHRNRVLTNVYKMNTCYVHPNWLLKCVTFLLCCRCVCLEDVISFFDYDSCEFKKEYFISKFIGTVHILFTKTLSVESILEYPCPSPCLSSCPCLAIVGVFRKTSTLVQRHWPNIGSTLKFKQLEYCCWPSVGFTTTPQRLLF